MRTISILLKALIFVDPRTRSLPKSRSDTACLCQTSFPANVVQCTRTTSCSTAEQAQVSAILAAMCAPGKSTCRPTFLSFADLSISLLRCVILIRSRRKYSFGTEGSRGEIASTTSTIITHRSRSSKSVTSPSPSAGSAQRI